MRWNIKSSLEEKSKKERTKTILKSVLENRGIINNSDAKNFLNPKSPLNLTPEEVGIDKSQLKKAIKRINEAINNKEQIVIFGDYDADGITATAIIWETLHYLGAKALPFIPHREKHGYGLSIDAIDDLLIDHNPSLIITVDNGIVAHKAAEHISSLGIDLIITDHHVSSDSFPKSLAVVQTTKLAGAGVSWILSKEIIKSQKSKTKISPKDTLDLATIGTVADQVPLTKANRVLVKEGLVSLSINSRVGIHALLKKAQLIVDEINAYHINFVIAPRINAMGRLAHGLDSLRLLCTKNQKRADDLSIVLDDTNQSRKDLTFDLLNMAKELVSEEKNKLLIIEHKDFHEGVIGLVAGKLTETHYKPSIVIGIGDKTSKASARSVTGVNIIELIRKAEHHLVNAGGHPMAAGFTIETNKIKKFKDEITKLANENITEEILTRELEIECEIKLDDINWELYKQLNKLKPYGMGNRKPIFCMKKVKVLENYLIGKEKNHLKLLLPSKIKDQKKIDALWFGKSEKLDKSSQSVDIAFTIEENSWNNKSKLQLLIKDLKT